MGTVSVILPTYNESGNILKLIQALEGVFHSLPGSLEVIVVDDNSPDGTGGLVAGYTKTHANVRVFVRTRDRGLGNSIRLGMEKAHGEVVIGMDADFNHDPATIPAMLEALVGADLVVASRFLPGGGMEERWRLLPTRMMNLFYQVLGLPVTDNTSGFYAIRKKDLKKLGLEKIYYGYGDYHLRLVAYAKHEGLTIREVPTYYRKRDAGQSKSQLLQMMVAYTKEVWRLRLLAR